ncbi:MAG: hypothetical protein AB2L09_06370 [Coriobacteriia bacterium]
MVRSIVKRVTIPLLVVAIVAIILVSGPIRSNVDDNAAAQTVDRTDWPKNAKGLTYGNALFAKSLEDEPDLQAAWATNGKLGYAYKADLYGPVPSSPEEALRLQAENAGKDIVIPVYEVDGETQIGVFVIQGSHPE